MQPLPVLVLIVLLALIFDFINGFHDTANAVATSLATGALRPRTAIILVCAMNLLGALAFTGVAQNMAGYILQPLGTDHGLLVIIAALIAASTWNLLTWYFGLPSSSSHALLGSLAGAAWAAVGFRIMDHGGFQDALAALFLSPPLAFLAGFLIISFFKLLFYFRLMNCLDPRFYLLQRIAAALQAFSHGSNDAQKTMGVISLALLLTGNLESLHVPLWVQGASALALALGTAAGGWRTINTMANGITRLIPASGLAADLGSALTISLATFFHLPVSTTHVLASSIMGVGATGGRHAVRWATVFKMLTAWFLTLPAVIFLGVFFYLILW